MVRANAGITHPSDLEGKRVLLRTYQNTQAIWMKGIFSDQYDLNLDAVDWYALDDEPYPEESPTELTGFDLEGAYDRISQGNLDALVLTKSAQIFPLPENTATLFNDVKNAERQYYKETGIYPIMHNVVVRDDILAEHPWVATELQRAFRRSWKLFAERIEFESKYPLVWWQQYRQDENEIFGDIWKRSFELHANLDEVNTLVRYAHEQGLINERFDASELFYLAD
jgi:4,5-dihydroxyphthalate decarboxylase